MSISSATKSLAEDIEASYATRIAEVSDIVKETHQTLQNFQRENKEMADTLKNDLSSSERDRRQEFSTFIGNIREEVATTIAGIATDHHQAHTQWENLSKTMTAKRARK
jgi:DNA-directed RNA polymerase subunit F